LEHNGFLRLLQAVLVSLLSALITASDPTEMLTLGSPPLYRMQNRAKKPAQRSPAAWNSCLIEKANMAKKTDLLAGHTAHCC
jgi:hypothetical protein